MIEREKQSASPQRRSSSGVSRYAQLAAIFRRNISSGHWPTGRQIPTINELAESHGVARATVRQALGILEDEQLIERFRAKGTFVTHKPEEQLWCEVETDWSRMLKSRDGTRIELLAQEADRQLPAIPLSIGEPAKSYRYLRRRHSRNGKPFLVADVYIDERICGRIPQSAFASTPSLKLLTGIRGLRIADVRQTLTIGEADVITAEMLDIHLNAPVAFVQRQATDTKGRLLLVTDGTYRGDLVRLDIKLK